LPSRASRRCSSRCSARAEFAVDCRLPPGLGLDVAERRARDVLGDVDGLELDFTESVVGNGSPPTGELMDAIAAWLGDADPSGEAVPVVLPAFTDCRWFRAAFPDCVAYGFFPQRHQDLYTSWPLMHSADERLDVRDLGFATQCFADLPRRLLA
jgi:acetylornithine deacetylase/succinyl-diaminopimelate desuccinylase-like protein